MTNKELHEEIICIENELVELKEKSARLEAKLEEMKKVIEGDEVFKPDTGQNYYFISMDGGEVYTGVWSNHRFDHNRYALGNCFPTEQSAEDTVRALKLIQKARESQDGFVPNWEDSTQRKYLFYFDRVEICVTSHLSWNIAPIFGYWGDKSACEKFIIDNHDELLWFFTEYRR